MEWFNRTIYSGHSNSQLGDRSGRHSCYPAHLQFYVEKCAAGVTDSGPIAVRWDPV
jgi:hypothetical protein